MVQNITFKLGLSYLINMIITFMSGGLFILYLKVALKPVYKTFSKLVSMFILSIKQNTSIENHKKITVLF